MPKPITITDVAIYAGVSRATAGRVIGNYGIVSDEARKKVTDAIAALNYQPNSFAQGLRNRESKTIAVVLGSIKNSYCNSLVYAIEKEATENGYNVLICNTQENVEKERLQLQNIYGKMVDGICLISAFSRGSFIPKRDRFLYNGEVPLIVLDREIKGLEMELIQSTNKKSSYDATSYLISAGHTKIGVIGTKEYSTVIDRVSGYKKALRNYNIPVDESLISYGDYFEEKMGAMLTNELLRRHPEMTALYVLNDSFCPGVLIELKKWGLKIPDDLSLLVWDDSELNELHEITAIVQQVDETGKRAVQRLLSLIKNPELRRERQKVLLPTELIVRASCGSPRIGKLPVWGE